MSQYSPCTAGKCHLAINLLTTLRRNCGNVIMGPGIDHIQFSSDSLGKVGVTSLVFP